MGTACSDGAFCNGTEECDGTGACGNSSDDACMGDDFCDESLDMCIDVRRVFVSSTTVVDAGDLVDLSSADAVCQGLATTAGLPGTYMAWLSDDTDSPDTRFTKATVPYVLVDGTLLADTWDDLVMNGLDAPINLTDTLATVADNVWTGTDAAGTANADHCDGWSNGSMMFSGQRGLSSAMDSDWTSESVQMCDESAYRIYCFQQ